MYRLSKYARSIADAVPCIGLPLLEGRLLDLGRGRVLHWLGLDWGMGIAYGAWMGWG